MQQFNFLVEADQAERLREVAKVYGTNTSAFLREMIGAICGDNPEGPGAFLQKLGTAIGRQQQLDLFAQEAPRLRKPALKGKRRRKRVRTT